MDPSEFEGTVKQEGEILNAGSILEEFFASPPLVYNLSEYEQDNRALELSIARANEVYHKWSGISFDPELHKTWDEQALKITDLREEYVQRRKILAKIVKSSKDMIDSVTSTHIENSLESICRQTGELTEKFKAEFDFLAAAYKYSESAFLSTYKLMRELPDPKDALCESSKCLIKSQDIMRRMHGVLSSGQGQSSTQSSAERIAEQQAIIDKLTQEHEAKLNENNQNHQKEIRLLEDRLANDLKQQERSLTTSFEHQSLDLQQQYEKMLAVKDAEMASILVSLQHVRNQILETNEKEKLLDMEVSKRRELEEKVRQSFADIADLRDTIQKKEKREEELKIKYQQTVDMFEKERTSSALNVEKLEQSLKEERERILTLQSEMATRIPVDIEQLAIKLGFYQSIEDLLSGSGSLNELNKSGAASKTMQWMKLEELIIDSVRKNNSTAAEARVSEQELKTKFADLIHSHDHLKQLLADRDSTISALEKDLFRAHEALKSSRGWTNSSGLHHTPSSFQQNTPSSKYTSSYFPQSQSSSAVISAVISAVQDPELQQNSQLSTDSNQRMLEAVEHQRDRFAKLAKEKEAEYMTLKASYERLQEDQEQLRNENLELYKRLRYLRASSRESTGSKGIESLESIEHSADESGNKRHRRNAHTDIESVDRLDNKYTRLYEEKIDPFKLEELDRQAVISRLNVVERGLGYVVRMFMQDSFARKALVVYLLLIHLFAMGYVVQVLNPQLIEEVDSYAKAKFAEQTFDLVMDREHPDN